jgi:hypothetical protein
MVDRRAESDSGFIESDPLNFNRRAVDARHGSIRCDLISALGSDPMGGIQPYPFGGTFVKEPLGSFEIEPAVH